MSDEVLIKVNNVSKKFCRTLRRSLWYGVRDVTEELLGRQGRQDQLREDEFWAVKDVSFKLKRGECLGLIGGNGAGKTTLLKMLNGLIKPDQGCIEIRGRVGGLIALGAGFNPILTGRENIYINGAVLGLSKKEIEKNLDNIIDFSELHEFIDAPVQSYSSGMKVRLGFSIATVFDPDVLILDEVLAVGDAAFRNKCYHRMASIRKNAAVIFVSHNMDQISRTATTALFMKKGVPVALGEVSKCAALYDQLNSSSASKDQSFLSLQPPITEFNAVLSNSKVVSGAPVNIDVTVNSTTKVENILFKVLFYNAAGAFSADGSIEPENHAISLQPGVTDFCLSVNSLPLKNGKYFIAINIIDSFGDLIVWSYKNHQIDVNGAYSGAIADCQFKLSIN